MSLEDDVRGHLANPAETVTLDFKDRVGWASLHAQIELARDVVCMANRNGGVIVVGVADRGGGRFEPVGLGDDDPLPDPTDLGKVIRKYFDPPVTFECTDVAVDGKRYGVIRVEEFSRVPSICRTIGNDEKNVTVVRPGYLYRRSDALECAPVDTAGGVHSVIESAVAKTGAAVRAMVSVDPVHMAIAPVPSISQPQEASPTGAESEDTLRLCDLVPVDELLGTPLLAIIERISDAAVRSLGSVIVPRSIDPRSLPPSAIVREPRRVLIERSREGTFAGASSLIEVNTNLRVRMREGLWEPEGTVDFTSLFTYTFACLLFARRFYEGTGAIKVDVHIGLARPLGRRLTDDPTKFSGFHKTYVATSGVDLVATRRVEFAALADPNRRVEVGRDIATELSAYFGFVLNDDAFTAHLDLAARMIPGLVS